MFVYSSSRDVFEIIIVPLCIVFYFSVVSTFILEDKNAIINRSIINSSSFSHTTYCFVAISFVDDPHIEWENTEKSRVHW